MISIIIPVFNHHDALARALHSISNQTYQDIEVIVVDDGSVPPVHIQNEECSFSVTLVRQENKGAPSARNIGFAHSRGDYVIYWDADVVGVPDMLETMLTALQKHARASFTYSSFYFGKKKMNGQPFDKEALRQRNYIHSTTLIRRVDVIQWDESLKRFQDWDFFLSLAEQEKQGVWVDEALFTVDTGGTMSTWLPRFAYTRPWRWMPGISKKVARYEVARDIVRQKHRIISD